MIEERRKVVLYATWQGRLLVFSEPDFPEVGIQPPGGTVEDGETLIEAAKREFVEETGIADAVSFDLLGATTYRHGANGGLRVHHRSFFHVPLQGSFPEEWDHIEEKPHGGADPIRFHFFWEHLTRDTPQLSVELDSCLPELRARLGMAAD